MKTTRLVLVAMAILVPLLVACKGDAEAAASKLKQERDKRSARIQARLADSVTNDSTVVARWVLPNDLAEISGIVLGPDGRLFAHNDEQGRVSVIDPMSGFVSKAFDLKGQDAQEDFEGITMVQDTFFMVTSTGRIYTFTEGEDEESVKFQTFDTRLGKECEFEGITYNEPDHQLIMPCKRSGDRNLRDQVVIYRVPLPINESRPRMETIPIDRFHETHPWKELQPTDIVRDSVTGNYIMVASPQKALIVLSPAFEVLRATPLPEGHEQPEGVAITKDRMLIISDEARGTPATITLYRWGGALPGTRSTPADSVRADSASTPPGRGASRQARVAPPPARDSTP